MNAVRYVSCHIPVEYAGQRLDQALAALLPDYSRARIQQWIKAGELQVDGQTVKPRDRVLGGEHIHGQCRQTVETTVTAQAIPLDIVFEDEALLVVNKPAGMVVHPAAGNPDNTLVNGLLHHAPELEALPRAGLVHRLDKDTSGLLVIARNLKAHHALIQQLQNRTMGRHYQAVVNGVLTGDGTVDAPIGRHPVDRKRMAVTPNGKAAVTHYQVSECFAAHTHLSVRLQTGRTHQIRVHMNYLNHPIVGDPVYGGRSRGSSSIGISTALQEALRSFPRQALHARTLALIHPETGACLQWHADTPADILQLLNVLRNDQAENTEQEMMNRRR
jgi:23S rRNA pseudouridine1911/1915/1917 synthase